MVRKATLNDIPALFAMARNTVIAMHAKGIDQWSSEYPGNADFTQDIERSDGYVWDNGTVHGYFALVETDPHYKGIAWRESSGIAVHRLMTNPSVQRTGVAKAMMLAIIDEAKKRHRDAVWIDTHPANDAMRALLFHFGFKERGFIDAIYRIAYERPTFKNPPQSILIFGNSGVGKTTLSKQLSAKLGIPYVHLDSLYWQENWQSTPRDQFIQTVNEYLSTHDAFVMDGNYLTSGTLKPRLAHTEMLIFLDYPTQVALNGIKKREKEYSGQARSDMADGCIEKIDQEFLTYVLNFNHTRRPSILGILQENQETHYTLRFATRNALHTFLESL